MVHKEMIFYLMAIVPLLGLVSGRLPAHIKFEKCPRYSSQLSQCLINSLDKVKPYLLEGIPEISFPGLDPFRMRVITIDPDTPGLEIRGEVTNIEARGGSQIKIQKLNIDNQKKVVELTVLIPKLVVSAEYKITGSVYHIPVDSTGTYNAVLDHVTAKIRAHGTIEKSGGLEHTLVSTLKAAIHFGKKSTMHIEPNETDKDTRLNADLINSLEGSQILAAMENPINEIAGNIIKIYANKVSQELPLQDLLTG